MEFRNTQIIQASDWSKTIAEVNAQTPPRSWIFRALEAPNDKNVRFQSGSDTIFDQVEVSVLSSFDKAWGSRSWPDPEPAKWKYEALMLREFKRAAYRYRSDLPQSNDYLEWLALARHYEMPSRLVDFTYTFYVASYFALSGKGKDTHGFILAINLGKLKEKTEAELPSWNLSPLETDQDFHNPVMFREFAFDKKPLWVAPVAPSRRNERLLNQRGLFLCPGQIENTFEANLSETLKKGVDVKLICLHKDLRTAGIQDLRQMNVDMRTLYPELTGYAQSIRDLVHMDIDDKDQRFKEELQRSISENPWC
jgi:hypothetical protein